MVIIHIMKKLGVYRNGSWVWFDSGDLRAISATTPRVYVHTDTMDRPLYHHADRRFYDSRSEFRKATRRHGCVELGNEMPANSPSVNENYDANLKASVVEAYTKSVWNN